MTESDLRRYRDTRILLMAASLVIVHSLDEVSVDLVARLAG